MNRRVWIASVLTLVAAIIFVRAFALSVFYYPETQGPTTTPAQLTHGVVASSSTYPDRLIIPSLDINAAVQDVGVNAQGNMRAPSNFTDVAWYDEGTIPGVTGSAVIDGHVNNGLGLDGVFINLNKLAVGNDIYVMQKNGTKLHFIVSDIEVYPYTNVPVDTLFNQSDTARLNLITCDGAWVNGQDTYDERLVIFSQLAER